MRYWLMKSEPDVFGIDDLAACPGRRTHWDGVRNFQARNFMRDGMRRGDLAFFYHSNCPAPAVTGIVEICKEAYPDHTQFERNHEHYDKGSSPSAPRWYMVDVCLKRKLKRPIELAELRKYAGAELEGLALLKRGNRLSVLPVTEAQWQFILGLE
jgi:predicted RNA-binding protein with PUA-like domain